MSRAGTGLVEVISGGDGWCEVRGFGKVLKFKSSREIDIIAGGLLYQDALITVVDGVIVSMVAAPEGGR